MGLFKWLFAKISCHSDCKYNGELSGCPQELAETISNIDNYKLSIKDAMIIGKILKKRPTKSEWGQLDIAQKKKSMII
tara:strand:- start:214 stop:447 length:234 start_codon:yes stop_codon:yes gene_type:complete